MRAITLLLDRRAFVFLLPALLALIALSGCGGDHKNPVAPVGVTATHSYLYGVFAGPADGGRLSIAIATTSLAGPLSTGPGVSSPPSRAPGAGRVVFANGTLTPTGGPAVYLGGTFDAATDTLRLSGGGYTLLGVYEPVDPFPSIAGTYAGPDGGGTFGCAVGAASCVKIFICNFAEAGGAVTGRMNMAAVDTVIAGVAYAVGEPVESGFFFDGTVAREGDARAIVLHGEHDQSVFDATGTWDTTTNQVGGVWAVVKHSIEPPEVHTGTWTGLRPT